MGAGAKVKTKVYFITATDTGVGKSMAALVLGSLLKERGMKVGYMKPVQCAGNDAEQAQYFLELQDPMHLINPFFAREALSPHLAFAREGRSVDVAEILKAYAALKRNYDVLIVEGAGGLYVPITDDYWVSDLIRDMDAEVIIVSRLALGTINHTLLTLRQAREHGLRVKGIIFNAATRQPAGVAESTNPEIIERLGNVKVLGTVPFIDPVHPEQLIAQVNGALDVDALLNGKAETSRQQDDKNYVWHPFTQMKDWLTEEPLIIDRAKGSYLIDHKGNKYLDGVSSLWVNVHGHGHPDIDQAIKAQVGRLSHSTLLGLSNTPAIELARELVRIAPKGMTKVFYSDNGSTAVEVALKMAYQYWQNIGRPSKIGIAHMKNSYHGDTLGSVSVGGIGLFHQVYKNLTFKTIEVDFPDCYRAPKGKKYPDYAFECLAAFEKRLKKDHKRIGAWVVEPLVQGAAGMIVWPAGILEKIAQLCRKYEILLIADEVATGFGRTGKMFACEHEGVRPDILCLAKGLSGGYLPIAATLTTARIFDGFVFDYKEQKTFFHGHTYTGNPLSCAAALANLKVFKKERTLAKLGPKINHLSKKLKLLYNLPHVGSIRQKGFMVGIELVKDRTLQKAYPWEERVGVQVCRKIREKGVILRPLGNVIVLMPPLSISFDELDHLLEATYWAIEQVTGNQS